MNRRKEDSRLKQEQNRCINLTIRKRSSNHNKKRTHFKLNWKRRMSIYVLIPNWEIVNPLSQFTTSKQRVLSKKFPWRVHGKLGFVKFFSLTFEKFSMMPSCKIYILNNSKKESHKTFDMFFNLYMEIYYSRAWICLFVFASQDSKCIPQFKIQILRSTKKAFY